MASQIQFKIEGLDGIIYSPADDIELKKPKNPITSCIAFFECYGKDADVKITENQLMLGQQITKGGKILETVGPVIDAKKQSELFQKAAKQKGFCLYARGIQQAQNSIVGEVFASISSSVTTHCPRCDREYSLQYTVRNPIPPVKAYPNKIAMLTDYALAKDDFSLRALSRLALVQGFRTAENLIDHCNKLNDDLNNLSSVIEKIRKTLESCNLQSGLANVWLSEMTGRLDSIQDDVKEELEKELGHRLQQIWDASYIRLTEELGGTLRVDEAEEVEEAED